jgi:UDP-glucose 4-epimerase
VKFAVTGASGFLGSSLTSYLVARGHEVRTLARTLRPGDAAVHPGVSWMQGDLTSPPDAARLIDGVDAVAHLAWANTPLTSNSHLPADAAANLLPTLTLLEAMRAASSRAHVIFASSGGAVYGASVDERPFRESDACLPQSSYGIQKITVEQYLRMGSDNGWFTATALRIGNPYGVPLPAERRQGFIGTAVAQLRAGIPVRVFGNPANVRDYVHVDDVCRAFELAARPGQPFDVLNVGSGVGHSVEDILALIEQLEGRAVPIHAERSAAADELPSWVVLDVERAREKLGWAAGIDLREGLGRLLRESTPPSG